MRVEPVYPKHWSREELAHDREVAIETFRLERIKEPLEAYLRAYDSLRAGVQSVLDKTDNLTRLEDHALGILTSKESLVVFRYLAAPPVSADDLKTVAQAASLSQKALRADPGAVLRLLDTIRLGLDQRRFPWIHERRQPSDSERDAAILASTSLIASQKLATMRRNQGGALQEKLVADALIDAGFEKVPRRTIPGFAEAPEIGQFCSECLLGEEKADLVVRLWDGRIMAIECKVSNSFTNSVKRLNREAAGKASIWQREFGERHIVPVAVIAGLYKLHNLESAQSRNLSIFWSHDIGRLIEWINMTNQ